MQQAASIDELMETYLGEVEVVRKQLESLELGDDLVEFAREAGLTARDVLKYLKGKEEPSRRTHLAIKQQLSLWTETPLPGDTPAPQQLAPTARKTQGRPRQQKSLPPSHPELPSEKSNSTADSREQIVELLLSLLAAYRAGVVDILEINVTPTAVLAATGRSSNKSSPA